MAPTTKIMIYGITDWRGLYENSETRRRKNLGWVLTPNRHDSMAFGRLMARGSEGLQTFGAWMILLQLSSRGPYCYRGILCDSDGHPYSIEDMAVKTRALTGDLEAAIKELIKLGWMFETKGPIDAIYVGNPQPYGETDNPPVDSAGSSVNLQGASVDSEVSTEKSCAKNKSKSKNKNKPPHTETGTKGKASFPATNAGRGVIYSIPKNLKTDYFLKAWAGWVSHLRERFGGASSMQLEGHLTSLKEDSPQVATQRINQAVALGFRMPCDRDKLSTPPGGPVRRGNDVAAMAQKIADELGFDD